MPEKKEEGKVKESQEKGVKRNKMKKNFRSQVRTR
jgi:hypothetical protein